MRWPQPVAELARDACERPLLYLAGMVLVLSAATSVALTILVMRWAAVERSAYQHETRAAIESLREDFRDYVQRHP